MQKFFSNRKLVITVICVIIAIGLMTVSLTIRARKTTPAPQKVGNDLLGNINRVIDVPIQGVNSFSKGVKSFMATYEENQALRKNIDSLEETHAQNEALKAENKQLKELVNLKKSITDYDTIATSVINRTPSSWQDTITIGKGTLNGIKKNQPVLAGNGLIGRVVEANYTTSKVELISNNNDSDNRFAIQVNATDGSAVSGIITGYDKQTNEIIMGQITNKKTIKKNTLVITSGLGGVTPKGLYVGKVARVKKDDYGLTSEVIIKPAADISNIDDVLVAKLR